MKGKGKGDRSTRQQDDCPLQFPTLKPVDHARLCPRYSAVLSRSEDDIVGLEEVDSLQTELETLLAAAAKRMHLVQSEIELLDEWMDRGGATSSTVVPCASKDKALASSLAASSSSGQQAATSDSVVSPTGSIGKRSSKGKGEDRPAKRMRTDSGRATYAQPTPPKSKGKVQPAKSQSDVDSLSVASESPRPTEPQPAAPSTGRVLSKNLTPTRFWFLVEPYCAEITPDDVKFLEEQLKACEDIGDYMKIPSLGRHYADKWTEDDMMMERDGGKIGDRRKSGVGSAMSNGTVDSAGLLRRAEDSADDSSPFGPLTQRLVQGLLEENLISALDGENALSDADAAEAATVSPRSLAKQLHIGNPATLERRIKRELEEIGILGTDDDKAEEAGTEEEDEILAELKKKQAELRAVSHQNTMMLRHMLKMAKEEIQQQELQKKMSIVDSEVIEAYRKIQQSKVKKKTPTKKEKEAFYKALKDRELIAKQLQRTEPQ